MGCGVGPWRLLGRADRGGKQAGQGAIADFGKKSEMGWKQLWAEKRIGERKFFFIFRKHFPEHKII
jgi:hypothetical protein